MPPTAEQTQSRAAYLLALVSFVLLCVVPDVQAQSGYNFEVRIPESTLTDYANAVQASGTVGSNEWKIDNARFDVAPTGVRFRGHVRVLSQPPTLRSIVHPRLSGGEGIHLAPSSAGALSGLAPLAPLRPSLYFASFDMPASVSWRGDRVQLELPGTLVSVTDLSGRILLTVRPRDHFQTEIHVVPSLVGTGGPQIAPSVGNVSIQRFDGYLRIRALVTF